MKKINMDLYFNILNNGAFQNSEYIKSYLISTYKYNDKIYQLVFDDELGIIDEIIEIK